MWILKFILKKRVFSLMHDTFFDTKYVPTEQELLEEKRKSTLTKVEQMVRSANGTVETVHIYDKNCKAQAVFDKNMKSHINYLTSDYKYKTTHYTAFNPENIKYEKTIERYNPALFGKSYKLKIYTVYSEKREDNLLNQKGKCSVRVIGNIRIEKQTVVSEYPDRTVTEKSGESIFGSCMAREYNDQKVSYKDLKLTNKKRTSSFNYGKPAANDSRMSRISDL